VLVEHHEIYRCFCGRGRAEVDRKAATTRDDSDVGSSGIIGGDGAKDDAIGRDGGVGYNERGGSGSEVHPAANTVDRLGSRRTTGGNRFTKRKRRTGG